MLDRARAGKFAYPAVNVTSLTTANAVLKGLADGKSDGKGAVGKADLGGALRAEPTPVTVGAALGDLVRIEGLAPGTRVVIAPPEKLGAGAAVTAAKK